MAPRDRPISRRARLSFLYFFALLASYSLLRPLRDEMSVREGVGKLPWLFSGTFVAIGLCVALFGWLAGRLPRRRFLPAAHLVFAATFLVFASLPGSAAALRAAVPAFFILLNVFSLFAISISWSLMSDLFNREEAKRHFGFVAAGGSAGALAGPAVTAWLAPRVGGPAILLVLAASFLLLCFGISRTLLSGIDASPIGGRALSGISRSLRSPFLRGIAGIVVCTSFLSTVLYFAQVEIVGKAVSSPGERTRLFALIDLAVNGLSVFLQLSATGPLLRRWGVGAGLAFVAGAVTLGFAGLLAAPGLGVLVSLMVVHRALHFAVGRPAREVLFVSLDAETRYKAKSVLDTIVYRGSDAASAWVLSALHGRGVSLAQTVAFAIPIGVLWTALSFRIGARWEGGASGSLAAEALP
ncbi:MAG: NTP/NDP exchange transporter [Thermoanaerobaculia bacterium]